MRRRTLGRAAEERRYLTNREGWLAGRVECARCGRGGVLQVHHRKGRRGALLLVEEWWVALCASCHEWVHAHPQAALLIGWSVHRVGQATAHFGCADTCTLPPRHYGLHSFEPETVLP